MDIAKLLEISEAQKEKLKQENRNLMTKIQSLEAHVVALEARNKELQDTERELLCQTPTKPE